MIDHPEPSHTREELRQQLLAHSLYSRVDTLPKLRVFMESHAFAVWDFMSLLKRLQADLAPARVPWTPPRDVAAARFINEIVLAEESDIDVDGSPAGHLDIYLSAMDEVGADTSGFRSFLAKLKMGRTVSEALNGIEARRVVRDFVGTTIQIAQEGNTVEVAADPIPLMFECILGCLEEQGIQAPRFAYYLKRHIELDGDTHGPLGRELLGRLTAGDEALEGAAERCAAIAISARLQFWTGIESQVSCLEGGEYRQMMGV
jgi:hypothetical protein